MKKLTRLFSLLLIFGLISAALPMPVASAATLTVCASGCDHTSINAAVAAASAGDTINVGPGLYLENVVIDKSLTLLGDNAIIDGAGSGVVVLIKASNVTFQGFLVQQSGMTSSDAGIGLLAADNCTLANNTVVNNFFGIAVMSSKNNTLSNNHVADNLYYGVVLEAYPLTPALFSTGNIITGNTITRSGRDGLYFGQGNDNNQVLSNTITDTIGMDDGLHGWEANGIYFWKSSGNTVTGNTITGNINAANMVGYGIEMFGAANNTITANTISGNYAGMVVRNSATSPITGNTISTNRINDNVVVNLYADPNFTFSIENNWWGTTVESEIVAKLASWVSDDKPDPWLVPGTTVNLDYNPWCANPECTAQVVEVNNAAGLQAALDSAPSGSTIRVNAGTYSQAGAFTINTDGLTLILEDGVVIQNASPCFVIEADNTRILGESLAGAKCVPTNGANGIEIDRTAVLGDPPVTGITIEGLEFDGTGQSTGAGIYVIGAVKDLLIVNNYMHDLFGVAYDPTTKYPAVENSGFVEGEFVIQGNLFEDALGLHLPNHFDFDATYNSWGTYSPTSVDASGSGVVFDPFTHVQLFLTSDGTPWADQVVNGNNITYIVSADLQNITGAEFTLKYDAAKLEFVSATPTTLFDPMPIDESGGIRPLLAQTSGEIKYAGWKLAPVSGLNRELFRVTFKSLAAGTSNVFIDPASDVFGMSPDSGPSNNVYAAALDTASVKVIALPTISSTNIQGYYLLGDPQEFQVLTVNPALGGNYAHALFTFKITGAEGKISLFQFKDPGTGLFVDVPLTPDGSGNLTGMYGLAPTGFNLTPGYSVDTTFKVTFTDDGSYPFELKLVDLDAASLALATYTNTAVVYEKPVITSPDLAGPYAVGTPEPVTLTITNPSLMPAPFSLVFNLPAGTAIVYDGVTYTCTDTGCPPIPVTLPLASNDLPFTFTFSAPFSGDITATLFDSDWTPAPPRELASLTVAANVLNAYTLLGSVEVYLGPATFRPAYQYGGIPVTFTKIDAPAAAPVTVITTAAKGANLTVNLMSGTYRITTNQPRVLNIEYSDYMEKTIVIDGNRTMLKLELLRGNAQWSDNVIDILDAVQVSTQYWLENGDYAGDVNFDGNVNALDLAVVGGNYQKESSLYYESWTP